MENFLGAFGTCMVCDQVFHCCSGLGLRSGLELARDGCDVAGKHRGPVAWCDFYFQVIGHEFALTIT